MMELCGEAVAVAGLAVDRVVVGAGDGADLAVIAKGQDAVAEAQLEVLGVGHDRTKAIRGDL